MNRVSVPIATVILLSTALFALGASPARGHVALDYPNGGEIFREGETVTIEWHVIIQHDTQNWDLVYSTTSGSGPWQGIAFDLPPGNIGPGSMHTYDWTLPPEAVADEVWVGIRQDNNGMDYSDTSDGPFYILPEFALLLTQDDLIRGQEATFQIDNAEPGETVTFVYSLNGEGDGPAIPQLGGLNLDILPPITLIGSAVADPFGTASISVPVPMGAPLIDVSTQAVIQRGIGGNMSVKSNPNTSTIMP